MASLTRVDISNFMGIAKNVSWCDPMGARPETARLKWTLIRGKRVSVIAGLVAVVTVVVAVGVILTCTGCIFAAIRQRSRRKETLSDQCILPEGSTSPSSYWNTIAQPCAGTPVSFRDNLAVAAKSDTVWLSADRSLHHVSFASAGGEHIT
jgi:hypothetical protein